MKKKTESPAVQQVRAALERAVLKIKPKLLEELTAAYRADADRLFNNLMKSASDPAVTSKYSLGSAWSPSYRYYRYTAFDKDAAFEEWNRAWESRRDPDGELPKEAYASMPPHGVRSWKDLLEWRKFIHVSYYDADVDAKASVENAHRSFVDKNTMKFASILGDRGGLRDVNIRFAFSCGVFQGRVAILFENGDRVTGEVSLKYVVRTNPRVTPYYQYPLNFTSATIGGQTITRPSEADLAAVMRR